MIVPTLDSLQQQREFWKREGTQNEPGECRHLSGKPRVAVATMRQNFFLNYLFYFFEGVHK